MFSTMATVWTSDLQAIPMGGGAYDVPNKVTKSYRKEERIVEHINDAGRIRRGELH